MKMTAKVTSVDLTEGEARHILQALQTRIATLKAQVAGEDLDDDEQFFLANDLAETNCAYESLVETCVPVFGEQILENPHELL